MLKMLDRLTGSKDIGEQPLFSAAHVSEKRRAEAWLASRLKRGQIEPFADVGDLTPALAELLLAKNEGNRHVSGAAITAGSTDINNGDWALNGETIIIAKTGDLNDGQHRCEMVIRSGRTIKTFFAFGVERSSRLTVDMGKVRKLSDQLGMEGETNTTNLAAMGRLLWQYDNCGSVVDGNNNRPTKTQVRLKINANPKLADSFSTLPASSRSIARSKSVLGFCHFIISRRAGRSAADYFILKVCLGDELLRNDPIYVCREKLMSDRRMRSHEKVELIFRAWNAFRTKRRTTKIHLSGELPALEA